MRNWLFLFFKMNWNLNSCKRIFMFRLLNNFHRSRNVLSPNFLHHFSSQHSLVSSECWMLMIRLSSLKHIMLLVVLSCSLITPEFHHFKFFKFPLIHGGWSNKSNVSSNRSMIWCTVIAYEDANSTACPDRVFLLAIKTDLRFKKPYFIFGMMLQFLDSLITK